MSKSDFFNLPIKPILSKVFPISINANSHFPVAQSKNLSIILVYLQSIVHQTANSYTFKLHSESDPTTSILIQAITSHRDFKSWSPSLVHPSHAHTTNRASFVFCKHTNYFITSLILLVLFNCSLLISLTPNFIRSYVICPLVTSLISFPIILLLVHPISATLVSLFFLKWAGVLVFIDPCLGCSLGRFKTLPTSGFIHSLPW